MKVQKNEKVFMKQLLIWRNLNMMKREQWQTAPTGKATTFQSMPSIVCYSHPNSSTMKV